MSQNLPLFPVPNETKYRPVAAKRYALADGSRGTHFSHIPTEGALLRGARACLW